ncbi:hypothetical protein [Microbacterium sp. NPDC090003]|uniref:hypothetical protein n=1 Tax=Microbacterium sp. NPDC090003 TaxID=3364203 RepID=UPI003823D6F6
MEFQLAASGPQIPGVMTVISGSIDGHPIRFDFHGPDNVEEKLHLVWAFDPRTTNQIGDASDPHGFTEALEQMDWANLLGALTH